MREYRLPIKRIQLLSHAIDPSWAQSSAARKESGLCVCIARLEPRKGVDLLMKAWSTVHAENPDAKLVIVGSGMQEKMIDDMIARTNGSVRRISKMPFEELRNIIRSAEVDVCPAYLEGFGLAAAEAMTAGTAVIASNADGLRCLIEDGETGWLFPMGDGDALARTILDALQDNDARKRVADAAQRTAATRFERQAASDALCRAVMTR
jgi:glycosyltransferase involved in cell wall biosynthesis